MAEKFKIEREDDNGNFYTIKQVPVFETHDTRGFNCDESWMQDAIRNFERDKANGYRPTIIIGHNVKGVEKKARGFLDNLVLRGKRLYADMVRVPKSIKEDIIQNAYPGRSVEILPGSKRILALALLGGTTPFFSLPQMVYGRDENSERSIWYRSPNMATNSNNGNGSSIDVNAVARAAAQAVLEQQQNYQREQEAGPAVEQLTIQQAAQYLQDNPDIQVFQAEDGNFYCAGDDQGQLYYAIPEQLLEYGRIRDAYNATKGFLGRQAGHMGDAARWSGRKLKEGGEFLGRQVKRVPGYGHAESAVKSAVNSRPAAFVARNARRANDAFEGAAMNHPYLVVGGAAAGGYGAAKLANRRKDDYAIDDNGVVYFEGQPIGEVVTYNDTMGPDALPPTDTTDPDLIIDQGAVSPDANLTGAEEDPGPADNMHLTTLNRGDSDQYELNDAALDYAVSGTEENNVKLYQLQQEVARLSQANQLLQYSKRAEQYKQYLLTLKKGGTPVGDIEQTCDYMLSLNDDQLKKYRATLESMPKIQLGALQHGGSNGETAKYSLAEAKAKQDFQQHPELYASLGVSEEDLKYAGFVRTNRFTNEQELEKNL